ncbi:hypothetical protein FRC19_010803 [Serendipita sp. 401]|nr:hypothetical protein FRC19_010803 [Serendipita sp. 401]
MAAAVTSKAFGDTHRLYVKSLYKRYLTNALDWAVQRDVWRAQAIQIRAEFDKHKNETDPRVVARVMGEAEAKLAARIHPDPYISAKFPGGTGWERNLPPPANAFTRFVTEEHHEHHHEAESAEETDYLQPEDRERIGSNFRLSRRARLALDELAQMSRREKMFVDALNTKSKEDTTKTQWDAFLVQMKEKGHDISQLEVDPSGRKYSDYTEVEKLELIERWNGDFAYQVHSQATNIIEEEITEHCDREEGIFR